MRACVKMRDEIRFNKQPYLGILFILYVFRDKPIRFIHFRYALIENQNIKIMSKNKRLTKKGKELKSCFKDKMKIIKNVMFTQPRINGKRSINQLSNALKELINQDIPLVKKDKNKIYTLTEDGKDLIIEFMISRIQVYFKKTNENENLFLLMIQFLELRVPDLRNIFYPEPKINDYSISPLKNVRNYRYPFINNPY